MTAGITAATHPVDAATVMNLLPTRPRLLALGEPVHGENDLLRARNDLFRQLVEEHGYRTLALESDCLAGLLVDDYVTGGPGVLDDVMRRGFSHEWGAFAGNRELVRWMRAYNDGRPPCAQVRFAGIDGPLEITGAASPRHALTALYDHLATRLDPHLLPCTAPALDRLLGADQRWTNPAAMRDPAQSPGRTPEAERLRLLADDLIALLESQAPHLATVSTPEQRHRAHLYARTATGLLRYHRALADTSPGRMARLLTARDAIMADNLLALAERGPTLVNAHNSHLQRRRSSLRMDGQPAHWWSAGAIVSTHLDTRYAFLATAVGTLRQHGVPTPPENTVEGRLYALAQPHRIVEPRRLATALAADPIVARESPWYGYAPLDPDHLDSLDGLLFVRDAGRP
ncbi:erythromycin esterase family protein [Actinoplanes teichomyceticus]|uniref:Erythromycin esterase-like protein n=1 Tax=Actinoplanes teichomyceticus TaxID=1867 RepID=A0A561VMM7_ACTTI|nr:erythromycin esterase family protein [Actinoplanes teichomyceticus]TWG12850.1 erythromycin esterase-like protein [Actinoplanes teichomyceticus]GIF13596.1 erythromycin esterase [Actinoplanes teichomyceticus]